MRIVIQTFGSRGDVQPYVALGAALRTRGHEVTLSAPTAFGDMVRATGLAHHEIDVDVQALAATPGVRDAMRSVRAFARAAREAGELIDTLLSASWQSAREGAADAIVYHPKIAGAPHVAERLGVPAILAAVVPVVSPTGAYESPVLPWGDRGHAINRLSHHGVLAASRRAFAGRTRSFRQNTLGLPPRPRHRTGLTDVAGRPVPRIVGISRHLVPEPPERPPGPSVFTGYWFTDPSDDPGRGSTTWTPPEPLARFLAAGPPPVYVGFGSMVSDAAEASRDAETIATAFRAEGVRGVLASGWGGLSAEAQTSADPLHIIGGAPHHLLFPRCAAVIHHGGAGTTHEGLRAGCPTAIRPFFGDQPFWARRVQTVGAGTAVRTGRAGELTVAAVQDALRVLKTPQVQAAARTLGAKMRAEPGADGAAQAVERFAASATIEMEDAPN